MKPTTHERNKQIREEIERLKNQGYTTEKSILLVAESQFLSFSTVHEIWYSKCLKITLEKSIS